MRRGERYQALDPLASGTSTGPASTASHSIRQGRDVDGGDGSGTPVRRARSAARTAASVRASLPGRACGSATHASVCATRSSTTSAPDERDGSVLQTGPIRWQTRREGRDPVRARLPEPRPRPPPRPRSPGCHTSHRVAVRDRSVDTRGRPTSRDAGLANHPHQRTRPLHATGPARALALVPALSREWLHPRRAVGRPTRRSAAQRSGRPVNEAHERGLLRSR